MYKIIKIMPSLGKFGIFRKIGRIEKRSKFLMNFVCTCQKTTSRWHKMTYMAYVSHVWNRAEDNKSKSRLRKSPVFPENRKMCNFILIFDHTEKLTFGWGKTIFLLFSTMQAPGKPKGNWTIQVYCLGKLKSTFSGWNFLNSIELNSFKCWTYKCIK